jgi:hypothetical protein
MLHKRSDVAASAVLGFEGAVVLIDDELNDILKKPIESLGISFGIERRSNEEVQIPSRRVSEYNSVVAMFGE